MSPKARHTRIPSPGIAKTPTGIQGLDEITNGGLPTGRPTLVCGAAGCGKTLFGMEFLVRGATQFKEPGVFMSFEESSDELSENVRSLGFDLKSLEAKKKIAVDHVRIERNQILETGEYDLEGLFIRLGHAVDSVGAKRVVLDTIEALFAGLPDELILRSELKRLFRWLKERGLTAVITAERGEGQLTRHGLEEYVADCVIMLDHRVNGQVSTRRLRIVKYRGSTHGTNEYPFLIGSEGFSVLPITSLHLDHGASTQRMSTGISDMDAMLGGKGFYRGSSILFSGAPGAGKSTLASGLVHAACKRGEKCLVFLYEESADQSIRNMRSVGMDLAPWIKKGLLTIHATRPSLYGLEQHLVAMHELVETLRPDVVMVDPISSLSLAEDESERKPTLMRLIDFLKRRGVTGVFTSLVPGSVGSEDTQVGVSSLMDAWILLRNIEYSGERNRTLYVLKSRGMEHSNQVREFMLSNAGISLKRVYVGRDRVLTGTARAMQEANEQVEAVSLEREHKRRVLLLERKRRTIEAQIAALQAELKVEEEDLGSQEEIEGLRLKIEKADHEAMIQMRGPKNGKRG
jgi:circadian clock protein KaiC